MNLLKAFDCISQELLITKLCAYGLSFDAVAFLCNSLKDLKQGDKKNDIFSWFKTIFLV